MEADRVLAFRLARSGLAARTARSLADAAACPASDFSRDAALLALAARADGVTRDDYDRAVDSGDLTVAYVVRGAIHALAPGDFALYGRALLGRDDRELAGQLGAKFAKLAAEQGIAAGAALEEVAGATRDALASGRALDKNALHEALRRRVRPGLMPWCTGCESHHVAPMLWRYGTVRAGVRLDSQRRYVLGEPGPSPPSSEAVRRFLSFYGPGEPSGFAAWAGITNAHARRLWNEVAEDLVEIGTGWLCRSDLSALESPPAAAGVRLLPPGDPYLQKPNRPLLAPDGGLRKRLFRPIGSPGAVLADGRLAGLWRAQARGRAVELTVERLGRLPRAELEHEAQRIAQLRGAAEATLVLD